MTFSITETFSPKMQAQWRRWLSQNHDKKREIWLVFFKKHTGKVTISYQDALDEALCFGWIDGVEKRLDEERFALRFTPRANKSKWSENNVARYKQLLTSGRMTPAGTAAFERKSHVYTAISNKKGAIKWHQTHKMAKNPTLAERIAWHKNHQKFCACRPIPKALEKYI